MKRCASRCCDQRAEEFGTLRIPHSPPRQTMIYVQAITDAGLVMRSSLDRPEDRDEAATHQPPL